MELNTLDLGRPAGATQWGPGTGILGPWLDANAAVLGGFGRNYGLWVKINVAYSNRR